MSQILSKPLYKAVAVGCALEIVLAGLFSISGFALGGLGNPLGFIGMLTRLFPGMLVAAALNSTMKLPSFVLIGVVVISQVLFLSAIAFAILVAKRRLNPTDNTGNRETPADAPGLSRKERLSGLFNDGRYADAVVLAKAILEVDSHDANVHSTLAIALCCLGRLDEAVVCFRRSLAIDPNNAAAHSNLGNALRDLGQLDEAAISCRRALEIKPDFGAAHFNLGNSLLDLGQLDDAAESYRRALALNPGDAEVNGSLGAVLRELGQLDEAVASYNRALAIKPDFVEAYNNMGNALHDLGRFDEAVASYRRALAIAPNYADAHGNLGNTLRDLGRLDEAVTSCRRALEIKPDFAEAHNNLGISLRLLGLMDEAEEQILQALEIKPKFVPFLNNLGALQNVRGKSNLALNAIWQSLTIKETGEAKKIFVECVNHLRWTEESDEIRALMVRALQEHWGRPSKLMWAGTGLVKLNPIVNGCLTRVATAWPVRLSEEILFPGDSFSAIVTDSLLHALLKSAPNCDIEMERFLTTTRQLLLEKACRTTTAMDITDAALNFYSALAQQCFINEYLFSVTDDEFRKACELRNSAVGLLENDAPVPVLSLLALATYFPLYSLPSTATRLLDCEWPEAVAEVLTQQIREPNEELQLRATLPRLTGIDDEVSLLVQNQYEENPYPRWANTESVGEIHSIDVSISQNFPLSGFKRRDSKDNLDILIAGCGTGQHSIETAQIYSDARVLAIDLSQSSLAYAKRKTRELRIASLEYAHADLLKLGILEQRFDLIESVGVLHHLADPCAGWRVLLSLLRPLGLMRLGFYSEIGRRNIVKARTFLAEQGVGATASEIRRGRQILLDLDEHNELRIMCCSSHDFFSTSACRDLLFHVQEHHMTLTGINAFLKENNMVFLGFDVEPGVLHAYRQRFPNDRAATNLQTWQIFENENPDTFFMYQFLIQKAQ